MNGCFRTSFNKAKCPLDIDIYPIVSLISPKQSPQPHIAKIRQGLRLRRNKSCSTLSLLKWPVIALVRQVVQPLM